MTSAPSASDESNFTVGVSSLKQSGWVRCKSFRRLPAMRRRPEISSRMRLSWRVSRRGGRCPAPSSLLGARPRAEVVPPPPLGGPALLPPLGRWKRAPSPGGLSAPRGAGSGGPARREGGGGARGGGGGLPRPGPSRPGARRGGGGGADCVTRHRCERALPDWFLPGAPETRDSGLSDSVRGPDPARAQPWEIARR